MPELPEAETIVRTLRPIVAGRRIVSAQFLAARVSRDDPAQLVGRTVHDVWRYGKQVVWELDSGYMLFRLGMTGAVVTGKGCGPYTRAVLVIDGGHDSRPTHADTNVGAAGAGATILFEDVRQFGSLAILDAPPHGLGPDPLEISAREFAERLRARDTTLKVLLLDQSFVRGIGNIYADEALFRAGVHPRARTRELSRRRVAGLHAAIVELLEEAIAHRGSSISDYVDARGERGSFQLLHRVYGKAGEPCVRCGATLRRIVVAQRGSTYCPKCQVR